MSAADWIALGVLVCNLVLTAIAVVKSFAVEKQVTAVHTQINSRMDQLLTSVGAAEKAKGVLEGKAGV